MGIERTMFPMTAWVIFRDMTPPHISLRSHNYVKYNVPCMTPPKKHHAYDCVDNEPIYSHESSCTCDVICQSEVANKGHDIVSKCQAAIEEIVFEPTSQTDIVFVI